MKLRKWIIPITIILILSLAAGCKKVEKVLNTQKGGADTSEQNLQGSPVTDEAELKGLWEKYLYHSIGTVSNSKDFNSPDEIDPVYIAHFTWFKYTADHGVEGLELVSLGSYTRLFPLDTVLEYAKEYFNIEKLDVSKISKDAYDPDKKAFLIGLSGGETIPSYTDRNSWGIYLDKVLKSSDGTITASLGSYDTYITKRTNQIRTYILKPHKDGSLYFAGGTTEYVNNHLVEIKGEYTYIDSIKGFDGDMSELSMLGEDGKEIIMVHTPYTENGKASIILVNRDTLTVTRDFKLNVNFEPSNIKLSGDKFIICLDDKILTLDKKLEKLQEIKFPQLIINKKMRKIKYDEKGIADVFFGGYDVSSDIKNLTYSDEMGVKLLDMASGKEKLLSKSIKVEHSSLINHYLHQMPRFIAGDKKVITSMRAYDGTVGYTLCNLENGTSEYIKIPDEGGPEIIRYDTGIINVNTPQNDEITGTSQYKTLYLDFKTGKTSEIKLQDPGDTDYIIPDYYSFMGENYGAFVTSKCDINDYANNMYFLNRLNINSKTAEEKLISVKAGEIQILGVLSDGKIIFWYRFSQGEKGICITK